MEDRIEQRIAIRATLDRVWSLVATPGWWLPGGASARAAESAREPGRALVSWGTERQPWIVDVVRVESPGYASFRWASAFGGAAPGPGNSTLVEFYVGPVGNASGAAREVGVTVVESGFASLDLPEVLRAETVQGEHWRLAV